MELLIAAEEHTETQTLIGDSTVHVHLYPIKILLIYIYTYMVLGCNQKLTF